jgi:hypothetical protein
MRSYGRGRSIRTLRDRQQALMGLAGRLCGYDPIITARRLVQVYNGGEMPSSPDHVYLTNPVELDGDEAEGGGATPNVDTSTTIPVVVLWNAPSVGDVLTAYAVGGRWVAERGSTPGSGGFTCGTCQIPRQDLTVSWTNLILGNGSTTLVYSGSPTTQWTSACTNQLLYQLVCTQNRVEFRVYYFLSGSCPTGQSQYCSTTRLGPNGLTQTNLICSPFLLTCTLTSSTCPNIATYGYTGFTISQ